jgi:diguanylate cyclase (GGDEF)-like protein
MLRSFRTETRRLLTAHRPRTVALWLLPGAIAAVLWAFLVPRFDTDAKPLLLALLVALFVIAERISLHVEVQRQTFMIMPTEVPLVLGLFLVSPLGLLVARLASGLPALVGRRRMRGKTLYTIGVSAIEVAIAEVIFQTFPWRVVADPRSWLLALVAVGVANLAGSVMVGLAIAVTNGRFDWPRLTWLAGSNLAAGLVSTSIGLIAIIVLHVSAAGAVLLVGVTLIFWMGYRAYGRFLRQHESLGKIYDFGRSVERARSDPAVLSGALAQAREMFNATTAILWSTSPGARESVLITVRTNRSETSVLPTSRGMDAIRKLTVGSRRSRRFSDRDAPSSDVLAALGSRHAREVIAVPLRTADHVLGTLEMQDRQGQLASFTDDDLRLLETLGTHLTAAIENQQLVARLEDAAYHDRLTDMPNRLRLAQVLDDMLGAVGEADEEQDATPIALFQLDIDRFKEVNDSLGHAWGDQLLVQVGRRVRAEAPPGSFIARVGTDEFAVLTRAVDAEAAEALARGLREAVSTPYTLAGAEVDVSLSVGVALAPEHAEDGDTLMRRVDVALSNTKNTGRPVSVYHATMDQASLHRLRLITQLRAAIEAGQIVVRYQPKIALRTREVVGAEALVRWNHPEFGEVVPDEFVPLAEVTGLVGQLTMHVLRAAAEQCRQWRDRDQRIPIAVNLSARNLLDGDFPERVEELLKAYDLPADLLTFELTENSVMSDPGRMKPVLHRLHEMGVGLSIDDFGTGNSSLAQLRRLPVDEVKIDKVFVLSMGTDLGDLAIVRAIIELGHSLGLRVVAEGVESELARDLLAEIECDVIQGFLVSRALDPDRLDAWLSARTTARPAQPGVRGRRLQLLA